MAQRTEYQYKHRRVILTNNIQEETFKTMESYGVNISQFIRQAIKEKINREWKNIKELHEKKIGVIPPW